MSHKGLLFGLAFCIGVGSGCAAHHHHHGAAAPPAAVVVERGGPPPHAPAHGYRHKHARDGVELVFDAGVGLYVVVGHAGVYCDGSRYFRRSGDVWQVSVRLQSGWARIATRDLPHGLRAKAKVKGKAKAKKHGHGHPPAKHGY